MISSQTSYYLRMRKRDFEIACQVKLRFGSSKIGRRFDEKLTDKFDLHVFPLSIEFFNDLAGLLEPCWKVSPSQVDQKSYQTKHEKMMRQDNQRVRQSFPNPYRARGAGWPRANQRNRCGQGMCGRGSVILPSKFLRFMNDEEKNKILCMGARGTCGFAGPCFISGPWTLFRGFFLAYN